MITCIYNTLNIGISQINLLFKINKNKYEWE